MVATRPFPHDEPFDRAVAFLLDVLHHPWFGLNAKQADRTARALLLFHAYQHQRAGELFTKTKAIEVLDTEHHNTANRHIDAAVADGVLAVGTPPADVRGKVDRRIRPLIPTPIGIALVEREAASMLEAVQAVLASLPLPVPASTQIPTASDREAAVSDPLADAQADVTRYTQTLIYDPDNQHAFAFRAQALLTLGHSTQALADANRAIAKAPRHFTARLTRALIFKEKRQWADALVDLDVIFNRGVRETSFQTPRELLELRADVLAALGRRDDAEAALTAILQNENDRTITAQIKAKIAALPPTTKRRKKR